MKKICRPESWGLVPISDLAARTPNALAIGPFGSDLKTSDFVDDGVPVVFVRNVRPNSFRQQDQRYVSHDKAEKLAAHKVRPGDLVVTKMGLPPCVTTIYPDDCPDGIVTADIIKLTPDLNRADPRFLSYYLNSTPAKAQVEAFTFGVTRPKVTLSAFRRFEIPLPSPGDHERSIAEQKRIADILDKADAIRRKRDEARRLIQKMPQAAFQEIFKKYLHPSRMNAVLSDVAEVVSGVAKGRKLNGEEIREVPYLRVANVQAGYLDLSEIKTIPATNSEIGALALQRGDVVMTEGGDHDKLGRGALWDHDIPDCIHQNHVFRVRTSREKLLPAFFVHYLQTSFAKGYFLRCAKKTTNLASINMTQLRALPVPLPPLETQEGFEAELLAISGVIQHQTAMVREVDDLFDSLVQRAFKGEL